MTAFHFPPMTGSSGQMRAVSFANTLVELGWDVHVLTAAAKAYPQTTDETDQISPNVRIHRAAALDTARHLSIGGKYPNFLEIPDRWWTWAIPGVVKGLQVIRRFEPDVIWATYPIATAEVIACVLARLTSLPLVADFRDPMTDDHYPREKLRKLAHARIEKAVMRRAQRVAFTSPGTLAIYRERYPEQAKKLLLIENGYDEGIFERAKRALAAGAPEPSNRIVLIHAGLLYPKERNPKPFFRAVASLLRDAPDVMSNVEIVLRGSGHDSIYGPELASLGIGNVVRLEPTLSHLDAITEMLTADGLLLFQASSCNHQTPAKLYEYLRSGKPILALTDSAGDTALVLRGQPGAMVAPLDDTQTIARVLLEYLHIVRKARGPDLTIPADDRHGRRARGVLLDSVLRGLVDERRPG